MHLNGLIPNDTIKLWLVFLALIVVVRWVALEGEKRTSRFCSQGFQTSVTPRDTLLFLQNNSACMQFLKLTKEP